MMRWRRWRNKKISQKIRANARVKKLLAFRSSYLNEAVSDDSDRVLSRSRQADATSLTGGAAKDEIDELADFPGSSKKRKFERSARLASSSNTNETIERSATSLNSSNTHETEKKASAIIPTSGHDGAKDKRTEMHR